MQTQPQAVQAESHLISLAAAGDLDAFNDLVLKYQDPVYSLTFAMLGERDAAEDAAQQTFISVFEHIRSFRGGSFRGWLLKIAANTCYDTFRNARRHPTTPLIPEDGDGNDTESAYWLADPRPSPETELEQEQLAQALYSRLDELPTPYRSAITLVDLQGLEYAEAAQVLGVPVGTLKSRLARGRLRMRTALLQEPEYRADVPAGWLFSLV